MNSHATKSVKTKRKKRGTEFQLRKSCSNLKKEVRANFKTDQSVLQVSQACDPQEGIKYGSQTSEKNEILQYLNILPIFSII